MIDIDALLQDLTPEQRTAVTTVDGPLLIVAGAGSGKTRVITRRVAYLMAQGIPGPSILAITFTNKAAGEMKSRVSSLLGRPLRDWGRLDQPDAVICTFHSLCLRILKHYATEVGLPANFSIYDSADQDRLLKQAIKAVDLSTTNFPLPAVHSRISEAKNKLRGPEAFASSAQDFYTRNVARIYTQYQKMLSQNNALDFDDLLMKTADTFRKHPAILACLQERFQYILIDEYQDTNHAQYIIAHLLAMKHNNICVVGDPDQCLPGDTPISTQDGCTRIEEVRAGDWVTSIHGGIARPAAVDRLVKRRFRGRLVRISTECGRVLRGSPNHIGFAAAAEGGLRPHTPGILGGMALVSDGDGLSGTWPQDERGLRPSPTGGQMHHRRTVDPAIPRRVASQQSSTPLHRAIPQYPPTCGSAIGHRSDALENPGGWGEAPGVATALHMVIEFWPTPLAQVFPGMVVPVLHEGRIIASRVDSIEYEDYDGAVYDLSVPQARNYVAGGIVVHNSIYAWRGADIQNILDFEKDYPKATVIRLEQNYRSTQTILRVASKLIACNRRRKDKTLWTQNPGGEKVLLMMAGDEHEEAHCVARSLREVKERENLQWSQLAVFYRINALSRVMEDAMRRAGIPYRIARGVDFYHRKEIKDVLAYLRLIANPADQISLDRVANTPARGISDGTLRQIEMQAISRGQSLYDVMSNVTDVPNLPGRAQNAVAQFVKLVERWRTMLAQQSDRAWYSSTGKGRVTTLMEDVVKASGLDAYLRKIGGTEMSELENVNELITSASEYDDENPEGSLEDYLARVSLVSDQDMLKDAGGAVTLMTLHAAKGLEFPVVAMIGMEEGILPHARVNQDPGQSDDQLEEERRLCFVGITRAQQRLILSRAMFRTVRGIRDRAIPSRFLAELPREDIEVLDSTGVPMDDRAARRAAEEAENARLAGGFRRGQMVRHRSFGIGKIAEISNMGQQTRVVVEFQRVGRKTLILEYAHLEPVG